MSKLVATVRNALVATVLVLPVAAPVAQAAQFVFPDTGDVTAGYNSAWHKKRGYGTHGGMDIAGGWRQELIAARDGVVSIAWASGGYGNLVVLDHENGYQTYYGHMAQINTRLLKKGKAVKKGDILGWEGTTGRSTGVHVHFEVRKDGKRINFDEAAAEGARVTRGDPIDFTFADLSEIADAATPAPAEAPAASTGAQLSITAKVDGFDGQPRDAMTDGGSTGIMDVKVRQYPRYHVVVANGGGAKARNVIVSIDMEAPYLQPSWYGVFDAQGNTDAANNDPKNPRHTRFASKVDIRIGDLAPGESKEIAVWAYARKASQPTTQTHPDFRAWVRHIDTFYDKAGYAAQPVNVGGSQTFAGGDLKSLIEIDIWPRLLPARGGKPARTTLRTRR